MSNPILNDERFSSSVVLDGEPMSIQGTMNKILMLLACVVAGSVSGVYFLFSNPAFLGGILGVAGFIAFLLVIVTCFNIKLAKFTAAPYAFLEGIVIGTISVIFEKTFPGIVLQAVFGTFVVLFVMLMLYKAKMIQYTQKFQAVLTTCLLSVLAIYLIQFVAMLFGRSIPGIFEAGIVGILFTLFLVVLAAMALIQDFFFIENASQRLLSKDYEWYGAMGLMITLIWLYTNILRLLAILNSRR